MKFTPKSSSFLFRLNSLLILSLFLCFAFLLPKDAISFTGSGSGTVGDPYQITSCLELQEMNDELDAHYILMNDIDCSDTINWNGGEGFEPMGTFASPFTATLDGQNHVITDLFINRAAHDQGLFNAFGPTAEIRNVGFVDVDISAPGFSEAAAIAGYSEGLIDNCFATGTVSSESLAGGLVGYNADGTIQDSYAEVNVTASDGQAGGLVAAHTGTVEGMIIRSYAIGEVTANNRVGGLVGAGGGIISDSYATGNVTGTDQVGGLIGRTGGTITNSYATGLVTGDTNAGGSNRICAYGWRRTSDFHKQLLGHGNNRPGYERRRCRSHRQNHLGDERHPHLLGSHLGYRIKRDRP